MPTPSAIIMKLGTEYAGIYCRQNGFVRNHGPVLLGSYYEHEKVRELIEMGEILSLDPLVPCQRDEGEPPSPAFHAPDLEAVTAHLKGHGAEQVYVFDDGEWTVNGLPIEDALWDWENDDG